MPIYKKNINLVGLDFPERLRDLRESRHLSKADLAAKAGLHYRTVHDLELGKRKRSQEKTLILLAEALGISLKDLLGNGLDNGQSSSPESGRRLPLWIGIGTLVAAVLVLSLGLLWHHSRTNAEWTLNDGQLVVRDEILGTKLWELTGNGKQVTHCLVSPWNSSHLLVGTQRTDPQGGRLLCLERASGDTVWTVEPDIPALVRAFGEQDVMSANFTCKNPLVANLDGDDTPEVIVSFCHGKYYPFAICTVRHDGTLRAQYAHKGHINRILTTDLDNDGKDEIIGAGTNNSRVYIGATVLLLDDKHCSGASVDSLCDPGSSESDSALARIVFPNYPAPYMKLMRATQLCAFQLQTINGPDEETRLSVIVRNDDPLDKITVFLDSNLRPVRAEMDDSFLQNSIYQWPDSLTVGTGPSDPDWLADWLAGYKRFEVGRGPLE